MGSRGRREPGCVSLLWITFQSQIEKLRDTQTSLAPAVLHSGTVLPCPSPDFFQCMLGTHKEGEGIDVSQTSWTERHPRARFSNCVVSANAYKWEGFSASCATYWPLGDITLLVSESPGSFLETFSCTPSQSLPQSQSIFS